VSVCPSVTLVSHAETVQHIEIFSTAYERGMSGFLKPNFAFLNLGVHLINECITKKQNNLKIYDLRRCSRILLKNNALNRDWLAFKVNYVKLGKKHTVRDKNAA